MYCVSPLADHAAGCFVKEVCQQKSSLFAAAMWFVTFRWRDMVHCERHGWIVVFYYQWFVDGPMQSERRSRSALDSQGHTCDLLICASTGTSTSTGTGSGTGTGTCAGKQEYCVFQARPLGPAQVISHCVSLVLLWRTQFVLIV